MRQRQVRGAARDLLLPATQGRTGDDSSLEQRATDLLPHLPYYLLLAAVVPVGPPVISRAIARMRVRATSSPLHHQRTATSLQPLGATRSFYSTPGLAATVVGAPAVRSAAC